MRLAIDATSLLGQTTGIGRTTASMIEALAARPDTDVTCFCVTWSGRDLLDERCPAGATSQSRPFPARIAHWLWQRTAVPRAEWLAGKADLFHGPNYVVPPSGRAPTIATVHDLTFAHYPDFCTPDVLRFPAMVQRAIDRGSWVHTGSEFVADEIREYFDVEPARVVAVHHGLDAPPVVQPGDDKLDLPQKYLLALGTIEPRKDHVTLIEAFDQVAGEDPELHLIIAGSRGWNTEPFEAALGSASHRDRITELGYVSDFQRHQLLTSAVALVFPSHYEGFGLPPLEAMQLGTPVITTDAGSLPEVVGDAAEFAATQDPDSLASAITRGLDPDRSAELRSLGEQNIKRFDWSATADALVKLYARVIEAA